MKNLIRKIANQNDIKLWDYETLLKQNVTTAQLIDRAAETCVNWILRHISVKNTGKFWIFCGNGNNGGDGLAIARKLAEQNIPVGVLLLEDFEKTSPDFDNQKKHLVSVPCTIQIFNQQEVPEIRDNDCVLDAIFGSGLNRPAKGVYADVIAWINKLTCHVISIDMPSGMYADKPSDGPVVMAKDTLTFQQKKLMMYFEESEIYTGNIHVLDIGLNDSSVENFNSVYFSVAHRKDYDVLPKRPKFSHKGTYGHALLIAGSYGKMGAAVLAAKACMRAGIGKLTVACPKVGYDIIQTTVPEAMAYTIEEHEKYVTFFPKIQGFRSILIGPGIERRPVTKQMLRNLLTQQSLPALVLDADAINLLSEVLSEQPEFVLPPQTILTPHVREFERLAGTSTHGFERHILQKEFSKKHRAIVVLKGAHTGIALPDGTYYFNESGNPGMATAGSGDVLGGIITALLAQGYSPAESAVMGVYVHGLAGDLAASHYGEYAMIASDIIDFLPNAFKIIAKN